MRPEEFAKRYRQRLERVNGETTTKADRFRCVDCRKHHNFYMVRRELWVAHAPSRKALCCIRCFEIRVGRSLTIEDFTDAPVNDVIFWALEQRS